MQRAGGFVPWPRPGTTATLYPQRPGRPVPVYHHTTPTDSMRAFVRFVPCSRLPPPFLSSADGNALFFSLPATVHVGGAEGEEGRSRARCRQVPWRPRRRGGGSPTSAGVVRACAPVGHVESRPCRTDGLRPPLRAGRSVYGQRGEGERAMPRRVVTFLCSALCSVS